MAAPVDSEILILVDGQASSQESFDLILEGVARAFEQQSFIDSVAEGPFGSIAASVMVFTSGGNTEALSWMNLSSAGDLQSFATSVREIVLPRSNGRISYGDVIANGAASIANSVAEGTIQQLTIIEDADGIFLGGTDSDAQTARNDALASGVDVINSIVFNVKNREDAIQEYYDANVVSGGENGLAEVIAGSVFQGNRINEALAASIEGTIENSVNQPTIDSNELASVPEPSVSLLGALAGLALLARRRRGGS